MTKETVNEIIDSVNLICDETVKTSVLITKCDNIIGKEKIRLIKNFKI